MPVGRSAGVHAGDATLVLPAQKIQVETSRRIEKVVHQLASSLKINDVFKLHVLEKGVPPSDEFCPRSLSVGSPINRGLMSGGYAGFGGGTRCDGQRHRHIQPGRAGIMVSTFSSQLTAPEEIAMILFLMLLKCICCVEVRIRI